MWWGDHPGTRSREVMFRGSSEVHLVSKIKIGQIRL